MSSVKSVLWLVPLLASAAVATPALAELKVVVTIKPVHSLVAQVMEGVGEPTLLVSGSASPHTYALKPSDARALNKADIFFRVSEDIEPFTGKVVTSLPKSVRVVTLAEQEGMFLLDRRTGDTFEQDSHEHEQGGGDAEDHSHDPQRNDDKHANQGEHDPNEPHHHEESSARDGHVWLDTGNARMMVEAITKTLVEASPKNAEKLKANAVATLARIDALEHQIASDLTPVKGKPFVVFHDAYQYFEHRFGLNAVGSITVSPEVQPSAKRLTEIRTKIKELKATCVFAEPVFSKNLVAAVTEGTGARSGTLDPEGTALEPGPGAYDMLLKNLAAGLKGCLAESS